MRSLMYHIKLISYIILAGLTVLACGSKSSETQTTPDESITNSLEKNIDDIVRDLHMEIKTLKAELDYHHKDLAKIKAQTKIFTNPFSVYNKEIVLDNGSSIFGKIIYQDQDVMKVETLIGQLIIDRNTIIQKSCNRICAQKRHYD